MAAIGGRKSKQIASALQFPNRPRSGLDSLLSATIRKSVIFNLFDVIIFRLEETFVPGGYFLLACNIAKNCCLLM